MKKRGCLARYIEYGLWSTSEAVLMSCICLVILFIVKREFRWAKCQFLWFWGINSFWYFYYLWNGIVGQEEQTSLSDKASREKMKSFGICLYLCGLEHFIPLLFIWRIFGHFCSAEINKVITKNQLYTKVPKIFTSKKSFTNKFSCDTCLGIVFKSSQSVKRFVFLMLMRNIFFFYSDLLN